MQDQTPGPETRAAHRLRRFRGIVATATEGLPDQNPDLDPPRLLRQMRRWATHTEEILNCAQEPRQD